MDREGVLESNNERLAEGGGLGLEKERKEEN